MRTIKELLILLREELPKNIPLRSLGLCGTSVNITLDHIINPDELDLLMEYMRKKAPITANNTYWWPYGELAPRLEFLDKLIKEIDEN